jgi:hypothetical protein
MQRRSFIKLSVAAFTSLFIAPSLARARTDFSKIEFDKDLYASNSAQVIMLFLYGGASQLAGNLTNIDAIEAKSQNSYYDYFRGLHVTSNGFWQEAGGSHLEDMVNNGDATVFRTCYSKVREADNNKSHGPCTSQNQKGSFDETSAGIVSNVANILSDASVIGKDSVMPFVTMEGDSQFYAVGNRTIPSYLKAVGLDKDLDNPYKRYDRYWYEYTDEERTHKGYNDNNATGFDPALSGIMDQIAQKHNKNAKIKDAFGKRAGLSAFIEEIASDTVPDLGDDAYPVGSGFAKKMQSAVKVITNNADTKIITMGTAGLGGWDDHDDARNYVARSEELFKTLKAAVAHLKALDKENEVSIMVFAEFGRNVNLNSAFGWDHGNLQNFILLGGKNYFSHRGVVGETVLDKVGAANRLYLKPKKGSYQFEPMSIAATLYSVFGVKNPEILTGGYGTVEI